MTQTPAVTVRETVWIPLADGRRLAARLWLPDGAGKIPAVLEYIPYRLRDQTRSRDEPIHHWLAERGYACLRVDMHGSGDSDGILRQEFQLQEQDDGLELVAWIAAQEWCDGQVAMIGKSWGGYAALQLAMRRPPALRAIIPVCAGDDRYDQSLHFTGGAILAETLWWTDIMQFFNMRPSDPDVVGPQWQRMWMERLDAAEPWIAEWLNHQRRDGFWQHASASDDYDAITCAVFAVGGWADYLSRSVPRLVAGLHRKCWGLAGPWGHHYPQDGIPGPAIGFLGECLRFLDATLKGGDGLADTPALRAWMPDWHEPGPMHADQTGRWVAERAWPSPRIRPRVLALNDGTLDEAAGPERVLTHRSPLTVGACATEWLSQGLPGEVPLDQRADDGRSLCFDGAPLTARLEILGSAVLELDLAVDQKVAQIAARLCDVAPDGTSLRVALGILNLTHRDGDAAPAPMQPGQRTRIRLIMPETAHAFAPGHRIRIALSTSYWPIVWPGPAPVMLSLTAGTSRVTLPERPPDPADHRIAFAPPEATRAMPMTVLEPPRLSRTLTHDLLTGRHVLRVEGDGGFLGPGRRYRLDEIGTVLGHTIRKTCEIAEHDPLSASMEIAQTGEFERGDWQIRLETRTRMTATATDFVVEAEARAYSGNALVHERKWNFTRARDLV